MAQVKLEGVRKVYGEGDSAHVAVHGVDLEVRDGEFVVLVGPSGCGKSTTLRMIAGLEALSGGTLWIGDRVVNDLPPKDRDIGMVFQSYALYPHMTVRENMAFPLMLRKRPKAEVEARVRQAAEILGLDTIMERRPKQLSGGQRQRVAIGRAIVRQPQVFLFDEPLSNLDAKMRVQMRREIAKLHRDLGVTVIYVTHDQVEAMTLGDRIVVMSAGHVQQIDTPLALYDRPANRFVAGFIGSPAMNFLDGTVRRANGAAVAELGGGLSFPLPPSVANATTRDGARVTVGVRPEDVHVAARAPTGAVRADFRLEMLEPLGNEILLYADRQAPALDITARVPPQPLPSPGEPITLAFDTAKMHVFDTESGERLTG